MLVERLVKVIIFIFIKISAITSDIFLECSDYSRLVNQNFNCGSRVQGQERASLNEYPHMVHII